MHPHHVQQSMLQKAANNITQLKHHFTHIKIHGSTSEGIDLLKPSSSRGVGENTEIHLKKKRIL